MKFKTFVVFCPFEGLFCSKVTTFVDYGQEALEKHMAHQTSIEFEELENFLASSSQYDAAEIEAVKNSNGGFPALIELAKKWGWEVESTESEI